MFRTLFLMTLISLMLIPLASFAHHGSSARVGTPAPRQLDSSNSNHSFTGWHTHKLVYDAEAAYRLRCLGYGPLWIVRRTSEFSTARVEICAEMGVTKDLAEFVRLYNELKNEDGYVRHYVDTSWEVTPPHDKGPVDRSLPRIFWGSFKAKLDAGTTGTYRVWHRHQGRQHEHQLTVGVPGAPAAQPSAHVKAKKTITTTWASLKSKR